MRVQLSQEKDAEISHKALKLAASNEPQKYRKPTIGPSVRRPEFTSVPLAGVPAALRSDIALCMCSCAAAAADHRYACLSTGFLVSPAPFSFLGSLGASFCSLGAFCSRAGGFFSTGFGAASESDATQHHTPEPSTDPISDEDAAAPVCLKPHSQSK